MTRSRGQEPPISPHSTLPAIDEAARFSQDIAAALGEGTLYLLLDPAAVWLVD